MARSKVLASPASVISSSSSLQGMVSVPTRVVTKVRCMRCPEATLRLLVGLKGEAQSWVLAHGRKHAACWHEFTNVAGQTSKMQMHEGGFRESPLVGS
jgi:hypothetical protein